MPGTLSDAALAHLDEILSLIEGIDRDRKQSRKNPNVTFIDTRDISALIGSARQLCAALAAEKGEG